MNADGGGVCIICVCNLICDICCVCVYRFCECVFECGWLKLCGSCEPLGVGTISWIGVLFTQSGKHYVCADEILAQLASPASFFSGGLGSNLMRGSWLGFEAIDRVSSHEQ